MSAARILDSCDAVVTAIAGSWSPSTPDAVARTYAPDVGLSVDEPDTLIAGRQVYVFPAAWGSPEGVTRSELLHEYAIAVLVVERYTDAGTPPAAWVDARVLFVEGLFNLLKDPTQVLVGASVQLYRTPGVPATVDKVYDLDILLEHKTFWSQFTVTFHEIVGTGGS